MIISELHIAQFQGLFPGKGCTVRLQIMPNSTSPSTLHLFPLPPSGKALGESRASYEIPTWFCTVYSAQEGTDRTGWCYGFDLFKSTWTAHSQACGKFCLINCWVPPHIPGHEVDQRKFSTSLCCCSGIITKKMAWILTTLHLHPLCQQYPPYYLSTHSRPHEVCFKFQFWSVTGSNRIS